MWMQNESTQWIQAPRLNRQRTLVFALLCTLIMGGGMPAVAQEATVPAFAGGLVFDASRSTIYAMEPDRLAAREIDNGDVLWTRADLAEPLALHQGRLLVLGNRERPREPVAYWLDPASGATLGEFELDLPEDVSFLISELPGERFQAEAFADGGAVLLVWDYVKRQLIGAPAVAGVNRAPKMPRVAQTSRSASPVEATIVDTTVVSESGVFEVSVDRAIVVDRSETGVTDFNRWAKLYGPDRSQTIEGSQYRARDGEHILASNLIEDGEQWRRHQWIILDDQDEPIGRFRLPVAFAPFAVGEQALAYRSQPFVRFDEGELIEARDLRLVVMDLESGQQAWQAALLDKTWREGMPP